MDVLRNRAKICTYSHPTRLCVARFPPHSAERFLAAEAGGAVRLWDTERGQVVCTMESKLEKHFRGRASIMRSPTCVAWYPGITVPERLEIGNSSEALDSETGEPTRQFLVGYDDGHILQWDTRQAEYLVDYSDHRDSVQSLAFLDTHTFASSAADLSLRIWRYGLPVTKQFLIRPADAILIELETHPSGTYPACHHGLSYDNRYTWFYSLSTVPVRGSH